MYTIIGTDGRQYGPLGAEQIYQLIAENRVTAHSLVQTAGSSEWKPLASFPELASRLHAAPLPVASSGSNPRASNKIIAGIFGILLGCFGIHKFILGYTTAGLIMLLVSLLAPILTCFTFGFLGTAVMSIIGLIEGILYLCKSDDDFVRTYVDGRREWF